jgi:hypothetical protein
MRQVARLYRRPIENARGKNTAVHNIGKKFFLGIVLGMLCLHNRIDVEIIRWFRKPQTDSPGDSGYACQESPDLTNVKNSSCLLLVSASCREPVYYLL